MSEPLQISVHVEEKRYQPTQEKTVVPGWEAKTVTPDKGYALSKVTVEGMPEPTESETFTENGTYDVGRIGTAIVDVDVDLQNKTITPTEQTQTIEADAGYDGLDTVTVNPIPPEYVVPTGSVDITQNGQVSVSGKATANVNVPQGVFPTGTKVITQNGTEDVTNYASVDVAVPVPSGTKQINITANGTTTEDVSEYADAEITVNTLPAKGLVFEDYDSDGYPHSARFVGTWTTVPADYCNRALTPTTTQLNMFQKIETIELPAASSFGDRAFANNNKIITFIVPQSVNQIAVGCFNTCHSLEEVRFLSNSVTFTGVSVFDTCDKLKRVYFSGNLTSIPHSTFFRCQTELYDFSKATSIPALYNTSTAWGQSTYGCVLRIPAALSDTTLGTGNGWESATNWSALTNIVWEVV
jgi:hypothetical protein